MTEFIHPQYVMVYGTLKQGKPNHALMQGSAYLGVAVTKFSNYKLKSAGCPMVYHSATGNRLRGELYLVTPENMKTLDRLEGHPTWYKRIRVPLEDSTLAWLYIMQEDENEVVSIYNSGDIFAKPDEEGIIEW